MSWPLPLFSSSSYFIHLCPQKMSLLTGKMSKQKDLQEGGVYVYFLLPGTVHPGREAGPVGAASIAAIAGRSQQCRLLLSTCAVNLESPKKFCPKWGRIFPRPLSNEGSLLRTAQRPLSRADPETVKLMINPNHCSFCSGSLPTTSGTSKITLVWG